MSRDNSSVSGRFAGYAKPWLFPLVVACMYGVGLIWSPEETGRALSVCGSMFRQLGLPMCFALVMMVLLNRFLSSSVVTPLLGKGTGVKGVLFSSLAGILSLGPIYAWYPLFKTLKDKGAAVFHVANFMSCRSIKPVLFPVMVAYFGWRYTVLFVAVNLVGALGVAAVVSMACPDVEDSEDG